jgi:DMSO reductase anchor subunit
MRPAYSVIVFTTASGAGYGLLVWLSLAGSAGLLPREPALGALGFTLALALITAGLVSSAAHLGRPERAWRAFSQWRTSWLSREGVMAVATYVPAIAAGLCWMAPETPLFAPFALLTALAALITLFTTGMIYASLRPIPQWCHPLTTPIYLTLGLASGAVLLNALLDALSLARPWSGWLALLWLVAGAGLKLLYWHAIKTRAPGVNLAAATGLGHLGPVRVLEAPHGEPNFVMREMGYRIARKHAAALRELALLLAFALPALATLVGLAANRPIAVVASLFAAVAMLTGLLIERWLFFAEAEHIAMVYYGAGPS